MVKSILFLLLLAIISFPIIGFDLGRNMHSQLSEEDRVFYGFIRKEAEILGKKYGMELCSEGGGGGTDKIWLMSLAFNREDPSLTEAEARKLIVNIVNDYVTAANNDAELRSHLRDYPFTPKNLELTVYNTDADGRWVFYPNIIIVSSNEGEIGYFTKDENKKYGYKTEKYETWDEAVAILQSHEDQE